MVAGTFLYMVYARLRLTEVVRLQRDPSWTSSTASTLSRQTDSDVIRLGPCGCEVKLTVWSKRPSGHVADHVVGEAERLMLPTVRKRG